MIPEPAETDSAICVVTFGEKEALEVRNRQLLFEDLLHQRTRFAGGPYEAYVQFSNFCNMSCIMCWDGRNPPTEKATPELLEKIGQQLGPHLSVITPYFGSEPLVLTWNETRDLARKYSILLCITTNVQYLDEARFHELRDLTETLALSIDSHIPEIMEIVRPGGNIPKVMANLATTARLCKEHRIECIVNIVLMTLNAPHLAETIEYLGKLGIESVNVIQMLDVNGRSGHYDPLMHFSAEYVAWIKQRALKAAEKMKMRVVWSVAGCVEHDFRPANHIRQLRRKVWNDHEDYRLRLMFPGFCRNAFDRLRVDSRGDVAPCCYAVQGELSLGNLQRHTFEEIWNGPSAQDLRRGMMTGDVPSLCSACRYIDPVPPQAGLPFVEIIDRQLANSGQHPREIVEDLLIDGPQHARRLDSAPTLSFAKPAGEIAGYWLGLGLGGEPDDSKSYRIEPQVEPDGLMSAAFPDEAWSSLKFNSGYWWNVWALSKSPDGCLHRCARSFCMIRHQPMERIADSKLRYTDRGQLPVCDLGVSKQLGWVDSKTLPSRPEVEIRRPPPVPGTRPVPAKSPGIAGRLIQLAESLRPKLRAAPAKIVVLGCIDQVVQMQNSIQVTGWLLVNRELPGSVEFIGENGFSAKPSRRHRPDIESAYPQIRDAGDAGFEITLKHDRFAKSGRYSFRLTAHASDTVVFQCDFVRPTPDADSPPVSGPWRIRGNSPMTLE